MINPPAESSTGVATIPDVLSTSTSDAETLPASGVSISLKVKTTPDQNDNTSTVEDMAKNQSLPNIEPVTNDETTNRYIKPLQEDTKSFVQTDIKPLSQVESTPKYTGAEVSTKRKQHAPGASLDLWHKRAGCAKLKLSLMH